MTTALVKPPTIDFSKDPKVATMQAWLQGAPMLRALKAVARTSINAETLARMALTVAQKNRALLDCDPGSFAGALIECVQMGLEPDSVRGEAYLVPFGTKVQLIPGYRGLIQLAYRSGKVESFNAYAAYKEDPVFDVEHGDTPHIKHTPSRIKDRGELIASYAVVRVKDSDIPVTRVVWRHEIDDIRARSKAGKDGPWKTDFEAMAIKTAVKRVCKFIPSSPSLQQAVSLDDQVDMGMEQSFIDLDAKSSSVPDGDDGKSRTEKVADDAQAKTRSRRTKPTEAKTTPTEAPPKETDEGKLRTDIKRHFNALNLIDTNVFLKNVGLDNISAVDKLPLADLKSIADSIS